MRARVRACLPCYRIADHFLSLSGLAEAAKRALSLMRRKIPLIYPALACWQLAFCSMMLRAFSHVYARRES